MQKTTWQWLGCGVVWAALVCSTSFAEDLYAPCWRSTAGTTYQNWSLDASNNPAPPEQFTNPNGAPQASFVLGEFGKGWKNQMFGSRQGGWDLGQNGAMTLAVPNAGGSANSWKYLSLQVTFFQGIYEQPAISIAGASLLSSASSPVQVIPNLGAWLVLKQVWLIQPAAASETVVITATANGALLDQVVLDTIVLEPLCPGNQTLNADPGQCGKANVNFGFAYPNGCVLNINCNHPDGSTFPVGVTPVTCAVTDFAGRSANCSFTITVLDTQPPVITCPAHITQPVDPGYCSAVVNLTLPIQENCPGLVVKYFLGAIEISSPHTFPVGTATVKVVATDAAGLSAECTFDVTVTTDSRSGDAFAPCWRGQAGSTMQDWQFSTAGIDAVAPEVVNNSYGSPTAAIRPGDYNSGWYGQTFPFGCKEGFWDLGRNGTISLSIPNNNNCPGCYKYIRVQVTQFLGAGVYTDLATVGINGATQIGASQQAVVETITDWGEWVAEESVWAVPTCPAGETVVVTSAFNGSLVDEVVVDTFCTQVACPSDVAVSADAGQCSKAGVTWPLPAIDGCLVKAISCAPAIGSTFQVGSTPVSCVVSDAESTRTCAFNVVVTDNEPPVARTKDITVGLDGSGHASITATDIDNGSSDNCGIVDRSIDKTSFDCSNKGANTVVLTVKDAAGNQNTATATVTVVDTLPPTIGCPANIVQGTEPGACTAVVSFVPTSQDNCLGASVTCSPASGASFAKGNTTVNCTVTDASGNTASCSFNVTVNDTEAPSLTCADIVKSADAGKCTAKVSFAPVVTDNCPGVSVVCVPASETTFNKGETPVHCTATDASGNTAECTFKVTVNDTEAPAISCPADIAKVTEPGLCTAVVNFADPSVQDNCPGATAACVPPSGSTFSKGQTTVTCTATDPSGNTGSCSFKVTVNDTTLPVVIAANIVTNTTGMCNQKVNYSVTATDNCAVTNLTCAPTNGSTFAVGAATVYCLAKDSSGNTGTASFTVLVKDLELPVLTCNPNILTNSTKMLCLQRVTFALPAATDNCTVTSVSCSPGSGASFPVGTNVVTCVAVDNSGNSGTCTFTVTVLDTSLPTITCPANVVTNITEGCSQVVNFGSPAVWDNCAVTNVTCTPPSGSTFALGTAPVTCVVMDKSGNSASCTFTVKVVDNIPPVVICPNNIVANTTGQCSQIVEFAATATDNCAVINLVCAPPSGSAFVVGATTVTCTASDSSGLTGQCTFTVTVVDHEPPVLSACPPDQTLVSDPDKNGTVATWTGPTATDNCGSATVICQPSSGSLFPVGTTLVTCTAADAGGNASTCQFTVIVRDITAPLACLNAPITYVVGGTDDGFLNPQPSSPSANQDVYMDGVDRKGFDQCTSNSWFAHSFVNLPAHVAEATLRIKIRACGRFPQNDTITLAFTLADGSWGTNSWTRRIGTYPVDGIPGILTADWVTGMEIELALNLAKLPNADGTTTDIIPFLSQNQYLDIYIQDDTGVDYMILEIKTCQCQCNILTKREPGRPGAMVTYDTPHFTDNSDPNPTIICQPASGSFFRIGQTFVDCVAIDSSGNRGHCSFSVHVEPVPGGIGLHVQAKGPNTVIWWPMTCDSYVLEQTLSLDPTILWAPAEGLLATPDDKNVFTTPNIGTTRYFRLRKL